MNCDDGYSHCINCGLKNGTGSPYCIECLNKFVDKRQEQITGLQKDFMLMKEWIGRIEKSQLPPPKKPEQEQHRCNIFTKDDSYKIKISRSEMAKNWYMLVDNRIGFPINCCPFCKMELI